MRITDENGQPLGLTLIGDMPGANETRLAVPGSVLGLPREAIGVMYGRNDNARGLG